MADKFKFRLGPADAVKYSRGDEWFVYDEDALLDLKASEAADLEAAMDFTIAELRAGIERRSSLSLRAAMYLSRRLAGVKEQFEAFDPQVQRIESERIGDDADPPDDGPDLDSTDSDHREASPTG